MQNDARRDAVRDATKNIKKFLAAGKSVEAREELSLAYKAIDKGVKRGLLKKNTAARKKSGLSRLIKNAK